MLEHWEDPSFSASLAKSCISLFEVPTCKRRIMVRVHRKNWIQWVVCTQKHSLLQYLDLHPLDHMVKQRRDPARISSSFQIVVSRILCYIVHRKYKWNESSRIEHLFLSFQWNLFLLTLDVFEGNWPLLSVYFIRMDWVRQMFLISAALWVAQVSLDCLNHDEVQRQQTLARYFTQVRDQSLLGSTSQYRRSHRSGSISFSGTEG